MRGGRPRGPTALLALLLIMAGCSSPGTPEPEATGPVQYGAQRVGGSSEEQQSNGGQQSQAGASNQRSRDDATTSQGSSQRERDLSTPSGPAFDDLGSTGDAAVAMLAPGSGYSEIVVEIDYATGRAPGAVAKQYLADSLRRVTGKTITFSGGNEIAPRGRDTAADELPLLSQRRSHWSERPRGSLWIVYLDRGMAGQSGVLGVATNATVVGMFPDKWRNRTLAVSPDTVESTIILHEVGHLLAQTEIGYKSPRDHRDHEHGHHNRYEDSVMYWAVETTGIFDLLRGGNPLYFDENDLGDLVDLAAGRF